MESALLEPPTVIRTPDQRLRVFVSSTLEELKAERLATKKAITDLHLTPVMFELGARPHPARDVYSSYLTQSHVFIGIYGDRYGWVAPGAEISGLEEEFRLSADHPRLIYIKRPAPERDVRLKGLIDEIKRSDISYKYFSEPEELSELIANDLVLLLTERFEQGCRIANGAQDRANIPAAATPLIGRDEHVADIKDLLRRTTTRLVTLTGTGGIGKTRLAMEVARLMGPEFRDGVYFVPLATVNDPELVLSTVVQTVFPGELGGQPPLQLLKRSLKDQQVLLVLDNFEQVIDAAPSIAELEETCPGLKMLITSREVLRLSGEQEYRVPMLALPVVEGLPLSPSEVEARIAGSAAVQLFVQRAQAIDPTFALTAQNAAVIAEICVHLDGWPLAIELAAARIRILTPQAILQHLGKSLAVLSSGTRDLPERHRTLIATIDWSYQLLSPEEQQLLCGLSVFTGGCTLEAVNMVTGNGPVPLGAQPRMAMYLYDPAIVMEPFPEVPLDLMERMESLVAKNLIYAEEQGGEMRFQMYPTIREYAAERAAANGMHPRLAENHCAYFLRLAEQLWPTLRGREASTSYQRLDQELANLRDALAWALENAPTLGLRLALALGEYWDTRGMPDEQIQWTDAVLEKLPSEEPVGKAIARIELARAAFRRSDLERCAALAREAAAAAEQLGNPYLSVDALMPRCLLAAFGLGLEDIVPVIQEGLAMSKRAGYTMATIEFLHNLAAVANFSGHLSEAIAFCDESLELATGLGATRWETISYGIRGFSQLGLGQLEASAESFNAALHCSKRFMDNALVIYPLIGKAQLALARGSTDVAVELLGAVERFCERKGTAIVPAVLQLVALTQKAVKAQVGDEAYERLRGIGRELQLREAMELAER
jgi:predicted ATPase